MILAHLQRVGHELGRGGGHFRPFHRLRPWHAFGDQIGESAQRFGAGADLLHGFDIQFVVASVTVTLLPDVGLFGDHNLIDHAGRLHIFRGLPRDLSAGQFVLQTFQQRHEIPNRIAMILHEDP